MSAGLFEVTAADVATTNDDWYTPRWIFDAAGLTFDLDVCAPVAPEFRTCPARRYLTIIEDGLTAPWDGLVWMNPPYSAPAVWVERWATHPEGLALLPAFHHVPWVGRLMLAADALTLLTVEFLRPDGKLNRPWSSLILVARGEICTEALARIAAVDKYAAGAYHVRPARA